MPSPSTSLRASLSLLQRQIIDSPLDSKLFVSGPAGAGKTTAGVERMRQLLAQGVPGDSILMLTPQRSLQEPYLDLLYSPERSAGGEATPATIGGLARRMCDLFWPIAGEAAGFAHPDQPPVFLTLETAQYYMARLVRPLLEAGYFESVTIDRNRLYSQIISNLDSASMVGFPHTEIASRLDFAYFGDPAQRRIYADAQDCANRFREYCLQNNLLDFSLQLEVFTNILWRHPLVRDYLTRTFKHLIYDNIEENGPRAHDIIRDWLPNLESALLIYDVGGGFRRAVGSEDPYGRLITGRQLQELCDETFEFTESFVMSENIAELAYTLKETISPIYDFRLAMAKKDNVKKLDGNILRIISSHFYPELLDQISNEIDSLISDYLIAPSEIVILAPYLSDALRFSITNRLEARNIPWRSHRPSRSLHDESASHALITFAALAHPHWGIHPPKFDIAYALMQSVDGLDLVRAQLLADIVYRQRDLTISSFENIVPDVQERITFSVGNRYTTLRTWIEEYRTSDPLPLDHFLRKLFGEVLSQAGFGYHRNLDSVRVAASLVESVRKFRVSLETDFRSADERRDFGSLGREYIQMLEDGVIAASYLEGWRSEDKEAVLVAPAYTFIMMNRPSTVQFWLDVGASGWYERLAQPLTHPYVLSREWQPGRVWSDTDEVQANKESLARLVSGLLHRCRERVYLGIAELGESGFEGRGELLRAFQKVITA